MKRILATVLVCCWCISAPAADESTAADQAPAADEAPAADKVPAADEAALDVETILSEAASSEDYVEDARCIQMARIRQVKALDERHVTFQVGRDNYYLVQLPHRCPGLRRNATVAYESTNSMSLCKLDTIRAFFEHGSMRLGPPCSIPGFQAITREQLALIKEALQDG